MILAIAIGCYSPHYDNCKIACDDSTGCPEGFSCSAGLCLASTGGTASCAGDGGIDVAVCANPWPFAASNFDPCASDFPGSTNTTSLGGTIDLGTIGTLYHGMHVLHVDSLSVTSNVMVTTTDTNPLPLLVVSEGDVLIGASIDLSQLATSTVGCGISAGTGSNSVAGGGPGGGLGFSGGQGGSGAGTSATPGGTFTGSATLIPLALGCPGGSGGSAGTLVIAAGGAGGGAIEISSRTRITLTATGAIFSDGGGGGGGGRIVTGTNNAGGGGGGASGGAILLEAPAITVAAGARLCAVGGAGGQGGGIGASSAAGKAGGAGSDCTPGAPMSGSFAGGDGGAGSATGSGDAGTDSNASTHAGGGGGGAAGIIRVAYPPFPSINNTAVIAPDLTP